MVIPPPSTKSDNPALFCINEPEIPTLNVTSVAKSKMPASPREPLAAVKTLSISPPSPSPSTSNNNTSSVA